MVASWSPAVRSEMLLIASLAGGILAVWAADNFVFAMAKKNAVAKEIQNENIRQEKARVNDSGSKKTPSEDTDRSSNEGDNKP